MPDQEYFDAAFRHSLKSIGTPEASIDFDDAVLAGLGQPGSWRENLMTSMRPVLSAMCCSSLVMLAVLFYTLNGSSNTSIPKMPALPTSRINLSLIDNVLDEPNLKADSLLQLPSLSAAVSTVLPAPAHRAPDLRHACLPIKTLIA